MLDEVMPRLGGEEVFVELRRIKADARVVLCSGYAECDATAKLSGKGLSGFIQKPFTLQSLSEVLKSVVEK
jgi:FixJ family two-component response regulator